MNVIEALEARFTCRYFSPEPLARDTLLAILAAANRTPSWANTQPWEIYAAGGEVLEGLRRDCLERFRDGTPQASDLPRAENWPDAIGERMRRLMAERSQALGIDRGDQDARREMGEANYRFFGAPVVVYLCMDRALSSWSVHDLGMLGQSIMLAAREAGVDSAIAYNLVTYPDLIRAALDVPDDLSIVIGIALGYAETENAQNRFRSSRRPLDEVVRLRGI